MKYTAKDLGECGEWNDDKQKKYENALTAFIHCYGRSPTEDETNEIWNIIAYPEGIAMRDVSVQNWIGIGYVKAHEKIKKG